MTNTQSLAGGVRRLFPAFRLCVLAVLLSFCLAAVPAAAVRIMCLGDSITYGSFGTPSDSYLGFLRNDLISAGWTSVEMFNRGYPGENTYDLAGHLDRDLAETSPEIVLFHIGTNDLSAYWPCSLIDSNIRDILRRILAYPTVRKAYLAALVPRVSPPDLRADTNELAQVQRGTSWDLAERDQAVRLADHNAAFVDTAGWETLLMTDNKHPNSIGFQVMAGVWAEAILDQTAPAAVTDLVAQGVADGQIEAAWTAPGDSGTVGRAAKYILRYSHDPISESNWFSADIAAAVPDPAEPGTHQTYVLTGLETGARYYLALRTRDEIGNFSGLSNVVQAEAERDSDQPLIDDLTLDGRAVAAGQYIASQPRLEFRVIDPETGAVLSAASGIDLTTVRIEIDGSVMTDGTYSGGYFDDFNAAENKIIYQVKTALGSGPHRLKLMVSDLAGNVAAPLEVTGLLVDDQARLNGRPLAVPNPYSPDRGPVKFTYYLTAETNLTIYVFDLNFRRVAQMTCLAGEPGGQIDLNEVGWDGRDSFGRTAPNGPYFIKLAAGGRVLGTIKLAVVR